MVSNGEKHEQKEEEIEIKVGKKGFSYLTETTNTSTSNKTQNSH